MVSSLGVLQPRPHRSPSAQSGKKAMGSLGFSQSNPSIEGDRCPRFHPIRTQFILVSLVAGSFAPAHGSRLVQIPNPRPFSSTPREIPLPDGIDFKTSGSIGTRKKVRGSLLPRPHPCSYIGTGPGNNNPGRWTVKNGKSLSLPCMRYQSHPV